MMNNLFAYLSADTGVRPVLRGTPPTPRPEIFASQKTKLFRAP